LPAPLLLSFSVAKHVNSRISAAARDAEGRGTLLLSMPAASGHRKESSVAKAYSRDYYEERQRRAQYSARLIPEIALGHCRPMGTAVDVGTWLPALVRPGLTAGRAG
jgi:hypothetical protein